MQSNFYIAQMAHRDVKLTTIDAMTKIYTKMRNISKQLPFEWIKKKEWRQKKEKKALLADRVYVRKFVDDNQTYAAVYK